MKKFFLVLFILVDLAIMAISGFLLYLHITSRHIGDFKGLSKMPSFSSVASSPASPAPAHPSGSTNVGTSLTQTSTAPASSESGSRKILFKYRNPRARQVSIRADFTGWKAESMHSDGHGIWTYQIALRPDEYAYCFTVDNKTFKDPANKRTKRIGTTLVSAIVVPPVPGH